MKKNVSGFLDAQEQKLSPTTISLINELYERDFILFDYPMIMAEEVGSPADPSTYRKRIEAVAPSIAGTVRSLNADNQQLREEIVKSIERLKNAELQQHNLEARFNDTACRFIDVERKLADSEQKLGDVQRKFADSEQKLADSEQKLAGAEQKLGDAEQTLGNVACKLADAEQKLGNAERKISVSESTLRSLYASRSWRFMAPFRKLFGLFKT